MSKTQKISEDEKKYRETVDTIAQEICKLSRQVGALLSGRLNRETIIILLAYHTKLPQRDIVTILNAIENMENVHIKKVKE